VGGDWDEQKWSPPNLPTKELIDHQRPDTPVWVNRYDGMIGGELIHVAVWPVSRPRQWIPPEGRLFAMHKASHRGVRDALKSW